MTETRSTDYLLSLLHELRHLPHETEWLEFKQNCGSPKDIGGYISALANAATLSRKPRAYMVWGINDTTHDIVGTSFHPKSTKKGNEDLEPWLQRLLLPRVDFRFHELHVDGKHIVILEIPCATNRPVQFQGEEFIRIGSYNKRLKDYAEKERALWRSFDKTPFEDGIAATSIRESDVFQLLDYRAYFRLLGQNAPRSPDGALEVLASDHIIALSDSGLWDITNLGAVLLAKRLDSFDNVRRRAVRVVQYRGPNRLDSIREKEGVRGYATGFEGLIGFVNDLIPSNEVMGKALRKKVPMYPEVAIRELVANALVHQDFHFRGAAPLVEIFVDRIEITSPGTPLVKTERFLDTAPRSRNEIMASFMRRIGVCEQRGSGIDKVVAETEFYQLPAPLFEVVEGQTRATLYAHKDLNDMDSSDKIRACYLHACLKWVQREQMTNASLRGRFGIEAKNSATVSRIIRETLAAELIRPFEDNMSKKYAKYVPFWS